MKNESKNEQMVRLISIHYFFKKYKKLQNIYEKYEKFPIFFLRIIDNIYEF